MIVRWLKFSGLSLVMAAVLSVGIVAGLADESEKPDKKESSDTTKKEKKSKIKPYDEIITEDSETKIGLFRIHRIEDDLYYEIPTSTLSVDMLWVTQIAETTAGNSYAGMPAGNRVVRWEKRDDRILLRDVRYSIRAETNDPIASAVKASNLAPIIKVFDVEAYGKDQAPVIKVTSLFTKEIPEFSAKRSLNAGNLDSDRSFIEIVKAFPSNIEVKVLASFAPKSGGDKSDGGSRSSGISALVHHSMVKLPDSPMKPRRHDSRVGFFNVSFVDFANNSDHEAETVRFITRWRLEKQNPAEKLSKPIKPIVFYVGRGTPDKWKSFVKAGIEAWQPAFEKAGFKNAILGRYAPDPREDPDWDAEDARISTIRWLPSNVENAFGPHVHDPRTGEILEADVRMYHNVQKLVRDWYFVQASASDERAQKLPMPDDLIGELIQFVVAHEVGHSLGFPHNMKASSSYTVEQLRDPEWTKENGTAPSIMDYARFNYVAQPGDGASLMPKIGPYDHFAVEWGYRRFSSDTDTEEELEKIVKRQVDEPMFRFGNRNPQQDSSQQTEDLGSDAVRATELGMKNLKRIAENLVEATCREGKNYDLLSNMYDQILGQWNREMGHVVNVVGGVKQINLFFGDADQRFFPQETEYQKQAVQFLIENALKTPTMFTSQDIVLRITAEGVAEKLLNAQRRVITGLVNSTRINRMIEHAEQASGEYYHPAGMLKDLSLGIFSELEESGGHPDLYRRNLQRSYLRHLGQTLEKSSVDSDLPALARSELIKIDSRLKTVEKQSPDALPQVHWKDLRARIEKALDKNKGQGD